MHAGALAALPGAALLAGAAASVFGALSVARGIADAVAIGRAGGIAAAIVAAVLAGFATVAWNAYAFTDLRLGTTAAFRCQCTHPIAALLVSVTAFFSTELISRTTAIACLVTRSVTARVIATMLAGNAR